MKRFITILFLLTGLAVASKAQTFALKTDLINWATASINLEPEVRVGKKSTIALGLSYNPWTFKDNKKWRHIRVQPEYRFWTCRPFAGHFLAAHASFTHFNAGNVDLPFNFLSALETQRLQGNEYAIGVGYGYHWILSTHWSIEAELGVGFSHANFNVHECQKCGARLGDRCTNKFMPTKASVSFIYVFK